MLQLGGIFWIFPQPLGGRGTLKDVMFSGQYEIAGAALLLVAAGAGAQETTVPLPVAPSAVVRPLVLTSGVQVARAQPGVLKLTLDDAIATSLKSNAQIYLRQQNERNVRGQTLTVGNALLPNLGFKAYSQAQEINLAAQGFRAQTLSSIMIPGFDPSTFSTIVKVNTTDAELTLSQALFNAPAYFLYRAAQKAAEAANWETLSTRGSIVLQTGEMYLQGLADQAQANNAAALVKQDVVVYEHAKAEREAGVGIDLDVLRAQVQLQTEQQELIRDENAVAKDMVQLNRTMGQPPGQALELVDTVPFAQLEGVSVGEAMKIAEVKRKDLRGLEAQLEVAHKTAQAVKYERLPTLGVGGFYGVLGETTGLYHGVFAAEGQLNVPVFEEAELRGERKWRNRRSWVWKSRLMGGAAISKAKCAAHCWMWKRTRSWCRCRVATWSWQGRR